MSATTTDVLAEFAGAAIVKAGWHLLKLPPGRKEPPETGWNTRPALDLEPALAHVAAGGNLAAALGESELVHVDVEAAGMLLFEGVAWRDALRWRSQAGGLAVLVARWWFEAALGPLSGEHYLSVNKTTSEVLARKPKNESEELALEIRHARGKYVLLPGCRGPDGSYERIHGAPDKLAPITDDHALAVLRLALSGERETAIPRVGSLAECCAILAGSAVGERGNALFRACAAAILGPVRLGRVRRADAIDALTEAARQRLLQLDAQRDRPSWAANPRRAVERVFSTSTLMHSIEQEERLPVVEVVPAGGLEFVGRPASASDSGHSKGSATSNGSAGTQVEVPAEPAAKAPSNRERPVPMRDGVLVKYEGAEDANALPPPLTPEQRSEVQAKTREAVRKATEKANARKVGGPAEKPPAGSIVIADGQLPGIVAHVEQVLAETGRVYKRGSLLVIPSRVERETGRRPGRPWRARGALHAPRATEAALVELAMRAANFVRQDLRTETGWRHTDLPARYTSVLLARAGDWPSIPELAGLAEAPILRADGTVARTSGYDAASGYLLGLSIDFPPVPERPTHEEAERALALLKEPLAEFPFTSEAARSVAISAMLAPLARPAMRTVPGHAFDAPTMGSGKTLLADLVALVATGRCAAASPRAAARTTPTSCASSCSRSRSRRTRCSCSTTPSASCGAARSPRP